MDVKTIDIPPLGPDRGIWFFFFFMVAAVLVVGAVVVLGAVDAWWALAAAVVVHLELSAAVFAAVMHLLGDQRGR